MPTPVRSISTEPLYHCYRCGLDKPAATAFYHHRDGSIVSGCKQCHADMAAERRARRAEAPTDPSPPPALGVVDDATPQPAEAHYRCEGCGRRATSNRTEGPRGWKRVRLTESEDPATLCPRCTAVVTRAAVVGANVASRRKLGRGKTH